MFFLYSIWIAYFLSTGHAVIEQVGNDDLIGSGRNYDNLTVV